MKKMLTLFLIILASVCIAKDTIEFYSEPGPGEEEMILKSLWGIDQKVSTQPIMVVASSDIINVEIQNDDSVKRIIFQVNDKKKKQFEDVTESLIDQKMAFVFDGIVFMNPVVRSAIKEGRFLIELNNNRVAFNHLYSEMKLDEIMNRKADIDRIASRRRSCVYIMIMSLTMIGLFLYFWGDKLRRK